MNFKSAFCACGRGKFKTFRRFSDGRNDVTDVLKFLKPELSLLGADSDIEFAQSREDLANIREEGTRVTPVDEDVIYVKLANVVD